MADCIPTKKKPCPSVDAGCGYKASVSAGKITIRATTLNPSCSKITVGLGDAVFSFDPKDPPETIRRLITKDASGTFAPPLSYGEPRHKKAYSEIVDVEESHTDGDGVVTSFTIKKIIGLDKQYVDGEYSTLGYKNHRPWFTNKRLD